MVASIVLPAIHDLGEDHPVEVSDVKNYTIPGLTRAKCEVRRQGGTYLCTGRVDLPSIV